MKKLILITLSLLATAVSANDDSGRPILPLDQVTRHYQWTAPPIHTDTNITKDLIESWVSESLKKTAHRLGLKVEIQHELLDVNEWATYVNLDHFVPMTAEGLPEGQGFNYNWYEGKEPKRLPTAEVTETGKFIMWWQQCNYRHYTQEKCKSFIDLVVSHESRHYIQWQALATEALQEAQIKALRAPRVLSDLPQPAQDIFMQKWSNIPHYQCREVEVYTTQVLYSEMPLDIFDENGSPVTAYLQGCTESQWAPAFESNLRDARGLFVRVKKAKSRSASSP